MRPKIHFTPFLLVSALIAILSACSGNNQEKEETPALAKTTKLKTHAPEISKKYPARVNASSDIKLSFRVAGPIDRVFVDEGDFVEEGDLLAKIDPRDYRTQLKATEAKYKEVKAEAERIKSLHEKGKVSDNEYDKAVSGLDQISAKYEAHQNELADTRLTAPFTGHITEVIFESHETIDAGMPVVTMIDTQRCEIVTHLPAGDYLDRDKFKDFTCKTAEHPDKKWSLELKNIVHQANLNGLYTARFKLKSPDTNKIVPGMSAEVEINFKREEKKLYEVPSSSVFEQEQKSHLWVVDTTNNTIQARPVQIVRIYESGNTVIEGDLEEGSTIISAGVQSLTEGQKIKEMEEPSKTNVGDIL
ncbi:MAG: efflux RND transporter periplasmic adaptor subunit [Bacteroidota bacterium]